VPEPADFPAPILAAAKKNPNFSALLENWDRETSSAKLEIPYDEALGLLRELFPNMKRLPNVFREEMEFPFHRSGGWRLALSFGHLWAPNWKMASAFLLGPGQPAPWEIEE
jgi:hypothetical protein